MPDTPLDYRKLIWVGLTALMIAGAGFPCDAGIPENGSPIDIAFPQAAVSNINTIYIPFTFVGQLVVVQARIGGQQGNFLFDTGSERLVLNKNHFPGYVQGSAIAATGNTGRVGDVTKVDVDTVFLSQLFILNVYAHVADLTHLEEAKHTRILGVLGHRVYTDFEVFLDYEARLIVLSRVDQKGERIDSLGLSEVPVDSVAFNLRGHVIILPTVVNGVRLQMMLDSGAELNLLDRRVKKKVLEKFTIIKRVNLVGMGPRDVEVLAGVLNEVECGRQKIPRMNTLFTSLDAINRDLGVSLDGVLGFEFLHTKRIMINYQKRKIYFFDPVRP